jgi:hypothetical protein
VNEEVKIPVRDAENNFLFRKVWLANYMIIDGPMSKVALTVTSTPNLHKPDDGTSDRFIVNLKAVLRSDLPIIKEKFGSADFIKADELNKVFMSGTIWVNEGQTPVVPMKGEVVHCNIGLVHSPALNKEVLRITGIAVQPAVEAQKLDVDALFADTPTSEFADASEEAFEEAGKAAKK